MGEENFFKDQRMAFAECRYSTSSVRQFKPHMHRTLSVGAVDSGAVEYMVDGRGAELRAGSLALINPETEHACNTLNDSRRSYYMLYLDVGWCLQVQRGLWGVESLQKFTTIRLDDGGLYKQYVYAIQKLMAPGIHLLQKEQLLHELMSEIFQRSSWQQQPAEQLPVNIQIIKKRLGDDLEKDMTLDELAGELGLNPYTMLRQFKKATGLTPHAYRTNCRIEKAKLLLQKGFDIADTAFECGFFDQSHLHRHFKAMTTVTPQEYRVNFVQ